MPKIASGAETDRRGSLNIPTASSSKNAAPSDTGIPVVTPWFLDGFHRFLKPYLRRHFHAVAIEREGRVRATIDDDDSLIVYANHPSWWDPLIAQFLNRALFPKRQFFAPIDAEALDQYRVFGKLGFYGVRMNSTTGAAAFLKQSRAILDSSGASIWLTPEGRFADARDHQAELMPGLAHLCSRRSHGTVLPLALEYVHWNERLPVCLARIGEPLRIKEFSGSSKSQWNETLTSALRDNQRLLSQAAIERSSDPFDNLLVGQRGAGGIYDAMRRAKSWATGKKFRAEHGEQFQ